MHPDIKYATAALLCLGFLSTANAAQFRISSSMAWQPTPEAACDLKTEERTIANGFQFTGYVSGSYPSYKCNTHSDGYFSQQATISNLAGCTEPEVENAETGICEAPELTCETGDVVIASPITQDAQGDFVSSGGSGDIGGCGYEYQSFQSCVILVNGSFQCEYSYESTGQPAIEGSEQLVEQVSPNPTDTNPDIDNKEDSSSTTYTTEDPVNNPDGSVTDSSTETTTQTTGEGTTIWNDDNNIYLQDSDGNTFTYQRQRTTTTNTDGSSTETVTTTKTQDNADIDTTIIDRSTGTSSSSSTNVPANVTTTVTNNTYDSSGNLTDTTSTTTGSTDGQDDETIEGNCGAPNQPSCEVTLEGSDQLTDPSGTFTDSESALDARLQQIEDVTTNDITGSLLQFNPVNLYENQTCNPQAFSSTYKGASFFPFEGFCSFYDEQMRPILSFFFYAMTVFGVYLIWVRTMRGNF